jgi:hypothetical protein
MAEVIAPLSVDERAVLMIAAEGVPMIPIGRWEASVKALARRGLMQMLDAVNYVITAAGQAALEAAEREDGAAIRKARGDGG